MQANLWWKARRQHFQFPQTRANANQIASPSHLRLLPAQIELAPLIASNQKIFRNLSLCLSPDHNVMWPFVSSQVLAAVFNLHFVSINDSPPAACISVVRNISVEEFSTTFFACVNKNRCEEAHEDK